MDELIKALTDYYDPRTDLVQKQHLHEQLNRFLIEKNSWQIALSAFHQQQQSPSFILSPIVTFFFLQIFEHSLRYHDVNQQQIRQILFEFYHHQFDSLPIYVRTKICLLIVQIARYDQQISLDDYFQTCYHLVENQSIKGLLLLTTTIEELGQTNEDCTIKRCQLLKTTLDRHVPHIVQIIGILFKKNDRQIQDSVLICFDRLINRLSILPYPIELVNDLFHYTSSTWSINSLNCIHELILKQHLPRQYDSILHSSLRHSIELILMCNENLSNDIQMKLIEILRTIFNLHLKRCETIEQFPLMELISALYKSTFQQTTQDGFYICIDIWQIFIEYLKTKNENCSTNRENPFDHYSQVIRSLIQELLNRIHYGQIMAEKLEETTDLNDNETAFDRYLRECVDLLSKLADIPLFSASILHSLIYLLQPEIDKYKNLQKYLQTSLTDPTSRSSTLPNDLIESCHQFLNSLNNLLYTFSHLANACLLNEHNQQENFFQTNLTLVNQFVHLIIYIIHTRLDLVEYSTKKIHDQIIQVQTRAFECVTNLIPWLSQMLVVYNEHNENRRLVQDVVAHIIDNCAPLIDANNSNKSIATSVGLLLSSLIPQIRQCVPVDQMISIKNLTHRIALWNVNCTLKDNFQLYKLSLKIIVSLILTDQLSTSQFFQTVFQSLNRILVESDRFFQYQHEQQLIIRLTFIQYTKLFEELIESLRTENTKTRQTFFSANQELIVHLNRFLPFIINRDTECETALISLMLRIFEILRTQMGNDLVNTILQTTFTAFNIENVRHVLRESKSAAHTATSRFLEFLSLLVNDPGNSKLTQQYLPTIIELCLTALYPAIRENFALDIRENYYKLVHNLLLNNWRYFFKGNVLTTLNGDMEMTINDTYFLQLMESIAWSFSQPDIEQFRVNLSTCNELESKCGLYTKLIFRRQMSQALLTLLLTVLLARSHELCRDEIISTLYSILHSDKTINFTNLIENYFEKSSNLNEKYQNILRENYGKNETDLPSFTQNLNDFIHDYRHYATKVST